MAAVPEFVQDRMHQCVFVAYGDRVCQSVCGVRAHFRQFAASVLEARIMGEPPAPAIS